MSTMGSQARAAEYKAATAAKQRQVSRDAEDQKLASNPPDTALGSFAREEDEMLPPKPVPISLGAFTKVVQPSRNKGNKVWKPFTMDDIWEDVNDGDNLNVNVAQQTSTPIKPERNNSESQVDNHRMPHLDLSEPPARSIRISMPATPIPVGPKSTTSQHERTYASAHHTPQSMGIPAPIMQPHPNSIFSSTPNSYVTPPSNHNHHFASLGPIFGPDDLSPTKQERKFANLKRIPVYSRSYFHSNALDSTFPPPNVPDGCIWTFPTLSAGFPLQPDLRIQRDHELGPSAFHHLEVRPVTGFDSRNDAKGPTGIGDRPLTERPTTLPPKPPPATHDLAVSDILFGPRSYGPLPVTAANIARHSQEEPYDRKVKMQDYVATATQEAMTKKGKTVLHNPDLRKQISVESEEKDQETLVPSVLTPQQSESSSWPVATWEPKFGQHREHRLIPWEVEPPTAAQKQAISQLDETANLNRTQIEILAKAINNPAPGLLLPKFEVNDSSSKSEQRKYNSDFEDWCELKPLTKEQRERTRGFMAKAAREVTNTTQRPQLSLQRMTDPNTESDSMLADSVLKLSLDPQNPRKPLNGLDVNDEGGNVLERILERVFANVESCKELDQSSEDSRPRFCKFKPVPEFAIDRRGALPGTPVTHTSYFDDNREGFHLPPTRIARDPRFRPQAKEGKVEDERKHRREAFRKSAKGGWP